MRNAADFKKRVERKCQKNWTTLSGVGLHDDDDDSCQHCSMSLVLNEVFCCDAFVIFKKKLTALVLLTSTDQVRGKSIKLLKK